MNRKSLKRSAMILGYTLCLCGTSISAQEPPVDIDLWKDGRAVMRVFLPSEAKQPAKAVVICPGGGYSHLAMDHEGYDWAPFFNEQGIAAIVLKYRMPGGNPAIPAADALEAIRLAKEHAAEWNINPAAIGIMGSSAGGHLASTVATHAPKELCPAFQILFYPVITMDAKETHRGSRNQLLGEKPTDEMVRLYSNELQVTDNTPPAFITLSDDDKAVPPINAVRYYMALKEHNIPATMYIYPDGGHGWGIKESFKYRKEMLMKLGKWLNSN
ncbi:MAG: alpha/beta hydrolase [Dysgonamonadaceae bacterium]|jgi:acetyl esterase/lipase|nr:alpha/beta hydrolase [Dysgonamonadaceae bacterium]